MNAPNSTFKNNIMKKYRNRHHQHKCKANLVLLLASQWCELSQSEKFSCLYDVQTRCEYACACVDTQRQRIPSLHNLHIHTPSRSVCVCFPWKIATHIIPLWVSLSLSLHVQRECVDWMCTLCYHFRAQLKVALKLTFFSPNTNTKWIERNGKQAEFF